MALRFEQHSPSLWAWYSDNTLLMEFNGTTIRFGSGATVKSGVNNFVTAPVSGLRLATGQLTTVSATDTVVTGLTTVTACGGTYDTDPADANLLVSVTKGDQAGTPAAGSIIVKTWKTDGTDPTPAAASTFSKVVSWWAVGS